MPIHAEQAQLEIDAVLKKYGIGTYMVIFKDPDSDAEATNFDGSYAWLAGHAAFILDLMQRRYNADRYVPHPPSPPS